MTETMDGYLDKLKNEHPCEAATSGRSENNT